MRRSWARRDLDSQIKIGLLHGDLAALRDDRRRDKPDRWGSDDHGRRKRAQGLDGVRGSKQGVDDGRLSELGLVP